VYYNLPIRTYYRVFIFILILIFIFIAFTLCVATCEGSVAILVLMPTSCQDFDHSLVGGLYDKPIGYGVTVSCANSLSSLAFSLAMLHLLRALPGLEGEVPSLRMPAVGSDFDPYRTGAIRRGGL